MHEVLVNRLGGLSLPRKSVVGLTDRPDMTLDVYRGRKTTMQQCNTLFLFVFVFALTGFFVSHYFPFLASLVNLVSHFFLFYESVFSFC